MPWQFYLAAFLFCVLFGLLKIGAWLHAAPPRR